MWLQVHIIIPFLFFFLLRTKILYFALLVGNHACLYMCTEYLQRFFFFQMKRNLSALPYRDGKEKCSLNQAVDKGKRIARMREQQGVGSFCRGSEMEEKRK